MQCRLQVVRLCSFFPGGSNNVLVCFVLTLHLRAHFVGQGSPYIYIFLKHVVASSYNTTALAGVSQCICIHPCPNQTIGPRSVLFKIDMSKMFED